MSTDNQPYTKCKKCGKSAVHLAMANYITFTGDEEDNNDNLSEYDGIEVGTDVSIGIHICFECFELEDVFIEYPENPEDEAANILDKARTAAVQLTAERLRLAREISGLSQSQAAMITDLDIARIEGGIKQVTPEQLAKMAEMYAVSQSWLAGDDDGVEVSIPAEQLAKLTPADQERLLALLKIITSKSKGDL